MAQANVFFKGEEKKFAINISAVGFDMDTDDFEVEVTNGKESITAQKSGNPTEAGIWTNEDGSLVIFYEEDTVEVPADEPGGEPTQNTVKDWFCIIDTQYFKSTGQLTVNGTAYIVDPKAYDGVRKSIDQAILGTLKNK
jgi:hypothetical protein